MPPISFSPNPKLCIWKGPLVSDLDCSACVVGYETTSESNATCVQPRFRPHTGWVAAGHELQDTRGFAIGRDATTSAHILLAEHTYAIAAPLLEPKDKMFSGYVYQ